MLRKFLMLCGLLTLTASGNAQTASAPAVFAIVGAKIEIGDGRVIDKGTVVLRDGVIVAVGAGVTPPPDAEIIKGDGLVVYPGFVDAYSARGLKLPDPQPDQDIKPDTTSDAPAFMREANRKGLRPELHAADYLDLNETVLAPVRRAGFTTANLAPAAGIMSGVTALVNLSGQPRRYALVKNDIGMDCAFRTGAAGAGGFGGGGGPGAGGYPGSLMGIIAHFRQTMLDAQYFRVAQTAFERKGGSRAPADESLAALQPVLNGSLPVLFDADTANQINRALKLADEFKFKVVINGGIEAYKLTDTLKKRDLPVLLSLNFGPEPGARRGRPGGGGGVVGPPPNEENLTGTDEEDLHGLTGQPPPPTQDDENADLPPAVLEERKKLWNEKVACAAQLHKASIPFVFTTKGLRDPSEFLPNVRRAIQAGLPREAALQALTRNAARLFGLEKQMGTVEAGKLATLTVMSGDFASETSRVRYLFVDNTKLTVVDVPTTFTPRPGGGRRPAGPPTEVEDDDNP